jgi:DNA replication protein DnaC
MSKADMDTWSSGEEVEEPSSSSVCPICKGLGFVYANVPVGHPDFGKAVPCRCVREELDKKHQARLRRYSGLAELHRTMTFASFDWKRINLPPEQRENLEWVFHIALNFAKSPEGWLVLVGVTGCGKTHLAAAIANERLKADRPALFIVVPDFLDHLRFTFNPESDISYDQLFESVKTAPLLILDDFGEQSTTPWAQEKLYQIINYRYNARLATVVTTRCSLDDIDDPISSRFIDKQNSMVVNINVPDYRGDLRPTRSVRKSSSRNRGAHRG